jgi:Domain of unknown function (DUF397)
MGINSQSTQPEWVKSSLSFANGNCVEVADLPPEWVTSTLSKAENCVEVADLPDRLVGVRNSREADGAVLCFTPDEWQAFIGGVRNGEFDRFGRLAG